jgi:hypothetical protein
VSSAWRRPSRKREEGERFLYGFDSDGERRNSVSIWRYPFCGNELRATSEQTLLTVSGI